MNFKLKQNIKLKISTVQADILEKANLENFVCDKVYNRSWDIIFSSNSRVSGIGFRVSKVINEEL